MIELKLLQTIYLVSSQHVSGAGNLAVEPVITEDSIGRTLRSKSRNSLMAVLPFSVLINLSFRATAEIKNMILWNELGMKCSKFNKNPMCIEFPRTVGERDIVLTPKPSGRRICASIETDV